MQHLTAAFAWAWAAVTVLTFGLALLATPISGSNASLVAYPYSQTFGQFPHDFWWQYAAIVQLLLGMTTITLLGAEWKVSQSVHFRLASWLIGLSTAVLLVTYYVQLNVVPVSLKHGEFDGLAVWIQYNPHGVFIALEELGYLLVIGGLAVLGLGEARRSKALAAVVGSAMLLAIVACVVIGVMYGIDKQDRLEVALISIAWIEIIVFALLAVRLTVRLKASGGSHE